MTNMLQKFDKENFLTLIRSGMTEPRALRQVNLELGLYTLLLIKNPEFKESVAEAKRARADVFYEKIVDSVDNVVEKDEVPAAKLRIDTLKYLAATDNPDKYSEKIKHQHDVNINIFQEIKDLPHAEAKRLIASADPFSVDAEFTELREVDINEDDDLEDLL